MFPACRIGDFDAKHCSPPWRAQGSPNVWVNFRPWSCQGHYNITHLIPCGPTCCLHTAPITLGAFTVRVNLRGAGSIGDIITNCTFVIQGSSNVWIGF